MFLSIFVSGFFVLFSFLTESSHVSLGSPQTQDPPASPPHPPKSWDYRNNPTLSATNGNISGRIHFVFFLDLIILRQSSTLSSF